MAWEVRQKRKACCRRSRASRGKWRLCRRKHCRRRQNFLSSSGSKSYSTRVSRETRKRLPMKLPTKLRHKELKNLMRTWLRTPLAAAISSKIRAAYHSSSAAVVTHCPTSATAAALTHCLPPPTAAANSRRTTCSARAPAFGQLLQAVRNASSFQD